MRARKRSPCRAITFSMRLMSVMSEPMPRIICSLGGTPRDTAIHRGAHRSDHPGKPAEDRLADQEVPDIELNDFGQRRDRLGGVEVEAVAGMHFETERARACSPIADALQLRAGGRRMAIDHRLAPGTRVDLDHRGADIRRG